MRVSPAPPAAVGSPQSNPQSLSSHPAHMSPAVGAPGSVVMPPQPNSGPGDNRSNSMHSPGYPGGSPHIPGGPPGPHGYPNKMGHMPPGSPYNQPGYQQPSGPQYHPTRPQSHMIQQYPQGYPAGGPQPPQSHQYPPRPHNTHMVTNQSYGYPHYGQPGWSPQPMGQQMMSGVVSGKGAAPPGPVAQGQPNSVPPNSNSINMTPRPHYIKPHMQMKMGTYPSPSGAPASGQQMYPNGPGLPPGMMNSREPGAPPNSMPPPTSTPQPSNVPHSAISNASSDHEHQPPSMHPHHLHPGLVSNSSHSSLSTSSAHIQLSGHPHSVNHSPSPLGAAPMGNSIGGTSMSNSSSVVINSNSVPTQIGPDGNPIIDEASQQSTVSNTSGASGDDRSCTPKPLVNAGKDNSGMISGLGSSIGSRSIPGDVMMGLPSGAATPINSAASPGTSSMTSQPDEFENVNSPGWPRSPSTNTVGVFMNNQPPPQAPQPPQPQAPPPPPTPEIYRTSKASDSIMRLYEMNDLPERKVWLDRLLRFMEDNKTPITTCPTISKNPLDLYALYLHVRDRGGFEEVTKNKHWKDVAAVMGIGASSSGSYTLRRHYMKHILAFECKVDRGGIDPQPIINQIESSQKKKSKSLSVPSPNSNSSSSMDGFSNGPHMAGPYSQFPPNSDLPSHMQPRPPTQAHPSGYQGYQGGQYPGYQGMGYPQTGYPNAGFPPDNRSYQPAPPPSHPQGSSYPSYQQPGYQRPGFPPPPPPQQRYSQDQYPMGSNTGVSTGGVAAPNYGGSQLAKQLLNPPPQRTSSSPSSPVIQNYQYPPKPGATPSPGPALPNSNGAFQGPRRHPDFDKGQPGWRPPSSQYGPYGSQGPAALPPPGQQGAPWPRSSESVPPPGSHPPPGSVPPQWTQPRYPPPTSQPFSNQPRWSASGGLSSGMGSPRGSLPPPSQTSAAGGKYMVQPPPTSFKSVGYGAYMGKQLFPMDSVEAVTPVLVKRKRLYRADVSPVDPWKLFMSLRCGLASEVSWALDVLNILLFDDQTVAYFGLNHMPGLLEVLIEHLRRGLINMFNICTELELGRDDEATGANKRIKSEHDCENLPWFACSPVSPSLELDLGRLEEEEEKPNSEDKEVVLLGPNYTMGSRTGNPVRIVKKESDLFLRLGAREWDKWEGYDSGVDTWSVGGGECTAHIICSMKSSVPLLPFTRLIPGPSRASRGDDGSQSTSTSVSDNNASVCESRGSHTKSTEFPGVGGGSSCVNSQSVTDTSAKGRSSSNIWSSRRCSPNDDDNLIGSESNNKTCSSSVNDNYSKKSCSNRIIGEKQEQQQQTESHSSLSSLSSSQVIGDLSDQISSRKTLKSETHCPSTVVTTSTTGSKASSCNGSPTTSPLVNCSSNLGNSTSPSSKSIFSNAACSSRLGSRRNNSRTSKLDAIVKRIKKEPTDTLSTIDSLFSKTSNDVADTKSLLDHYLKKDDGASTLENSAIATSEVKKEVIYSTDMVANVKAGDFCDVSEESKSTSLPFTNNDSVAMPNGSSMKKVLNEGKEEEMTEMEEEEEEDDDAESKSFYKSPSKLPSIPMSSSNSPLGGSSSSRRESSSSFKRPYDHVEAEAWGPDEASLCSTTEAQDWLARRVICIGTIIRNFSFVPGNEDVMSKSASLLALLGKTLLLNHTHPVRSPVSAHYDKEEDTSSAEDFSDWCSSLASDSHWWWPYLHHVHENTLVTIANISGHLDLSYYPEEISRPILDGLLHWVTCPASYGQDALPGCGGSLQSSLSPQKLALEALVKFCVLDSNTDLVLATPPFSRLDMLCSQLTRWINRGEEQVTREFAINLFHYFSAADSGVARVIAMQSGCVSHLVSFIEEAESAALNVANIQGVAALKENPELMGTSLDMVRRSANTLVNLSRVPDNARVIVACESRFLSLVMSQILDTYVASQLSQVLYNVAQFQRDFSPPPSPPLSPSDFMVEATESNKNCELDNDSVSAETETTKDETKDTKEQIPSSIDCHESVVDDSCEEERSSTIGGSIELSTSKDHLSDVGGNLGARVDSAKTTNSISTQSHPSPLLSTPVVVTSSVLQTTNSNGNPRPTSPSSVCSSLSIPSRSTSPSPAVPHTFPNTQVSTSLAPSVAALPSTTTSEAYIGGPTDRPAQLHSPAEPHSASYLPSSERESVSQGHEGSSFSEESMHPTCSSEGSPTTTTSSSSSANS